MTFCEAEEVDGCGAMSILLLVRRIANEARCGRSMCVRYVDA